MKMEKDLDFPFSLCWIVKAAWYAQAKLLGVCTLSRPEIGSAAAATATPPVPPSLQQHFNHIHSGGKLSCHIEAHSIQNLPSLFSLPLDF